MIVNQRWGFSVVVTGVVGIGIGVLIAVLAGVGSGSRLVIGAGVGLIIGGGLLAILDRVVVRRLDARARAAYEKLTEHDTEEGPTPSRGAVPAFDPETGKPLRPVRSLFFGLSLEVWTLFLVGCGILLVGVGVVLYLAS